MATKVGFQLESSLASKHLTDAEFIKGGYLVVESTAEMNALPVATDTTDGTIVKGSLCYCQADDKFYIYTGTAWAEKEFGDKITIDSTLSDSSTNPVQNKVIKAAIDDVDSAINELNHVIKYSEYSSSLEYTSNGDGTCYVSGIGTCTDTVVIIPPISPLGDQVTSIGRVEASWITGVVVPEGVTRVSDGAFMDCGWLTYAVLPFSLESIGPGAFMGCSSLKDIYYAESEFFWRSILISSPNDELESATIHYEYRYAHIFIDKFYRYITKEDKFYAISSVSKNTVTKDIPIFGLVSLAVTVHDVEDKDAISSPEGVTDFSTKVVLYYNKKDATVYGYITSAIKTALALEKIYVDTGWNTPDIIIDNYAGVIDDVLEAEYGNVYVVHEVKEVEHFGYFQDNTWHEISANAIESFVPRLSDVSKNKFDDSMDDKTNVFAYRQLHDKYDRAYVESKGEGGISGDYCLTPDARDLPVSPWVTADTENPTYLPSIPVRHSDGSIEVYTDENSNEHTAVSKQYLSLEGEKFVRRRPDEALDVYNANILAAHIWQPGDIGEEAFVENFDSYAGSTIPAATDFPQVDDNGQTVTDKDGNIVVDESKLPDIFTVTEASNTNSITVVTDEGNTYLHCNHPTRWKAESTYQFLREGSANHLAFLARIRINPLETIESVSRGISFIGTNDKWGKSRLWQNSNIVISNTEKTLFHIYVGKNQVSEFPINTWVDIRLEIDGLAKDSEIRLYLNNQKKYTGVLEGNISLPRGYQLLISPCLETGEKTRGFQGSVDIDNIYVGDIPASIRHAGYDSLLPIDYDYESLQVVSLDKPTIPLREKDGSILVKKELTEEDDDRIAVSKYYVDNQMSNFADDVNDKLGDIASILEELHTYAQNIINGGTE